jgi:NAD(P)-dependent dehydrogenase (short-subunit alcohol dehydrogenase family)
MRTEQKVAVITGASRGIGASMVKAFRGIGYSVVASSRSISEGPFADDPAVVAVSGDISSPETAERVVGAAIDRFGRIDTLINNAGILITKPFVEYSVADFNEIIGVNLVGFFHLTQRVARLMLQAQCGHIINMTAFISEYPVASVPTTLTALTKGGLFAVTRSLAMEYAAQGVRVNAISPGSIRTPMHAKEIHELLAGLQPMGRMGEADEIADAALYLEKAAFVTGEILHVDGGATAGRL